LIEVCGETVADVAQRLLAHHGGLRGHLRLDEGELARVRGLADPTSAQLKPA
jgi:DNA repair protein RadC